MPESEVHESGRARAKSQPGSRQPGSSTDRVQITSEPTAGMQELRHPWEALLGGDFSQSTFGRHAALLGDGRLSHPANAGQRALVVQQLLRDYGSHGDPDVLHIAQVRIPVIEDRNLHLVDVVLVRVRRVLKVGAGEALSRDEGKRPGVSID